MVSARMEIVNVGNKGFKNYVLLYTIEKSNSTGIVIGGKLYHERVIDLKNLIRSNGGANHIKRQILLGNVPLQNGVYLL
ncbi:hypothetical protein KAU33_04470 [Candidatus Dependentiae bacterium]|nr:hypothetical protein [Candidatus Dependentiae bacterium]